ncbi:MAG: hypothetical protein GY949_03070 [Gammaproteobacteria bacterium]|nr:hypothetical protein [Gammaproteobacteria bacterium]
MLTAETASAEILSQHFQSVRDTTLSLIADLQAEDTVVQTMPDVSPTKWHLAHVTWFFERFVVAACTRRRARIPGLGRCRHARAPGRPR